MSTKSGLMPSHCSELVVATKLKGVVMALPVSPSARYATYSAMVPLLVRMMFLTPR